MRSQPRVATVVMVALGAVVLIGGGIWALTSAPARSMSGHGESAMRHGILLVLNHRDAKTYAIMAIVLGVVGLALAYLIHRLPARWPLVPVPPLAIYLFVMVWRGRAWVATLEPAAYRGRSAYVKAATTLATVSAVYLLAVAAVAIAAWLTSRRAAEPTPAAPVH